MVRSIKYTRAFFRLIRIQNLFIIAATMYIIRWMLLIPLLKSNNMNVQLPEPLFLLLVFATTSIAASGYVINDYFDRKTDMINRPGKVILGRILRRRAGMFWHVILSGLGILAGFYVSLKIGHAKYGAVFIIVSGILWFYSTTYKRQILLGNIIVALLVAMVPLLVFVYELPLLLEAYHYLLLSGPDVFNSLAGWVIGYSIFAFLLTLEREIVKDLEDFEGDFAYGRQTVPIVWGVSAAKRIIVILAFITLALLSFAIYNFRWSLVTVLYGCLFILLPIVIFGYRTLQASTKDDYHKASILLKLIMLAGLLYTIIASVWVL